MARLPIFNPSLRMPVIDVVVAIVLIVAAGYFWFQTTGKSRLSDGHAGLREARLENRREVDDARESLRQAEDELARLQRDQEAMGETVVFLDEQIYVERDKIEEGQEKDRLYTDQLLDLRTEIQQVRDQRMAYNTDIFETEGRIREAEAAIADLASQALERNHELDRLDGWIAQARAELEANPPSRFPERSSLASVVEITDPEERVVVSLTRGVATLGDLDVGLLGSLGLSTGAESSIKEGGLYANLLLAHRRASVDFEGGISQLQSRLADSKDTGPFAGATFRFAPTRRERLFLLAGTRYSHEDVGLRLGLGLGRR